MLLKFYRRSLEESVPTEDCFYVECERVAKEHELEPLRWFLTEPRTELRDTSFFGDAPAPERGPQMLFETPFSSKAVSVCHSLGLPTRRIERSTRFLGIAASDIPYDPMTQAIYTEPIKSFDSGFVPTPIEHIPVLEKGADAIREANDRLGLGMDAWDIEYYTTLFLTFQRNPTDSELSKLGNDNSDHSRHWLWNGIQVIDGVEKPLSLMDLAKMPWKLQKGNNLVAFHGSCGIMRGVPVQLLMPENPGEPSRFVIRTLLVHHTNTAETHNHPTFILPFAGAETGVGGGLGDGMTAGRGSFIGAGFVGYAYGDTQRKKLGHQASPQEVLTEGSNGASDYGNQFGEPQIGGFCRSFSQEVGGQTRAYDKPILFTARMGHGLDMHVVPSPPEVGMVIVRIGGPAFRIGLSGGAASSMAAGANSVERDKQSVQRGDAEYRNRDYRVVRSCVESLEANPIEIIQDQGAGGIGNAFTELVEPLGGQIDIRRVTVGDTTMSIREITSAEFQESYALLVRPQNLARLQTFCEREGVHCDVLGEITGSGAIEIVDGNTGEIAVDLPLSKTLSHMPRKRFVSEHLPLDLPPLEIPQGLSLSEGFERVCSVDAVASKGHLVHKVDRSVTGRVARQQCCGPRQIPVADVGVIANGYFDLGGMAGALGENPNRLLINPAAGARMALAEMVTNLASARITSLSDVECRVNWMWPAKRPGQTALIYDAASALAESFVQLDIKQNGGKDSSSLEAMVKYLDGDRRVLAPGEVVIFGCAPVSDITKVVTPDFKNDGDVMFIDLAKGKNRLGGSALAQTFGQLGNSCPDLESPTLLKGAFNAVQHLIDEGFLMAYHDRSDGGLLVTLVEMALAGNCGANFAFEEISELLPYFFAEEAGMVLETPIRARKEVYAILREHEVPVLRIGQTSSVGERVRIAVGNTEVFNHPLPRLRQWWEAKSLEHETYQSAPETIKAEAESLTHPKGLAYSLRFIPTAPAVITSNPQPVIAILRDYGTNGDREMAAAWKYVGCEPVDVHMSDILSGRVSNLDRFQGLIHPGGFSSADVLGSGRGAAAPFLWNGKVKQRFERFHEREDTFSLGVCNGCQKMATVGWMLYKEVPEAKRPKLLRNASCKFESRWSMVKIQPSPAILFTGMTGSVLGIHNAHGEGRFYFPDEEFATEVHKNNLVPLAYVDPYGNVTEKYPYNPNGSPRGIAALCSPDGRGLIMMSHAERCFLLWQWPWIPVAWKSKPQVSPWLQMFVNGRDWCIAHR